MMKTNKEHELSKIMFNIIRESENAPINDEAIHPSDFDYQEEVKKFKNQITPRVEFTEFKIYPKIKNVTFGGKFTDISGFSFQFSLGENDGIYIKSNALQLTSDVVERINKLSGYYKNWSDEWANKVVSNYSINEL